MCMRACPWSLICPWSWISRIMRSQQCNSAYVWYHVLDILLSVSTLNYLCDLNQDEMWRTDILNVRIQRTKRKQGNCTGKMERCILCSTYISGWGHNLQRWSMIYVCWHCPGHETPQDKFLFLWDRIFCL